MRHYYSSDEDPVGCAIAGGAGGLIAGFIGGLLLLLLASLTAATMAPVPTPTALASTPDLRLTISEGFLNRYVEQPSDGSVRLDILPGDQVQLIANIQIEAFGLQAPVQMVGLFQFQLTPQQLTVQLVDTQISGIDLPPELTNFFNEDTLLINQDLRAMAVEISEALGTPLVFTAFNTTNAEIQLELKEAP